MTILKLHDEANVLFSDRNPFADPQALTLTDLIERIDRLPGCSPRERREISSALRTLARWFRLPPEAVPANLQFIRQRLVRYHPLQVGVSERRLQNVRSLALKAFRLTGQPASPSSYLCPLDSHWQALYDKLPSQYWRWGLSRLTRYCSAQGIAPPQFATRAACDWIVQRVGVF